MNLQEEESNKPSIVFFYVLPNKRKSIDTLFLNRKTEEYSRVLINRHLFENNIEFYDFFHFNREPLDVQLLLIKQQLTKLRSIRINNHVLATKQLAINLRHVFKLRTRHIYQFNKILLHCYKQICFIDVDILR